MLHLKKSLNFSNHRPAYRRGDDLLTWFFQRNIAVPFEKRLIFMTLSQPSAGIKYTDKFTFEGCFKS
ncbi:MAG: hypothetical protein LBR79_06660 [Oscillospiraceae bacterium]|nr:hypothetical protein [Oscillospiraceae bacterium]